MFFLLLLLSVTGNQARWDGAPNASELYPHSANTTIKSQVVWVYNKQVSVRKFCSAFEKSFMHADSQSGMSEPGPGSWSHEWPSQDPFGTETANVAGEPSMRGTVEELQVMLRAAFGVDDSGSSSGSGSGSGSGSRSPH
jgi:hypothetical protein